MMDMDLGDRMKQYESQFDIRLMRMLPMMVRIDGRAFHTWTRGLERPFCLGFVELMRDTSKFLLEQTHARLAYVQSDEISLVYHSDNIESELWFDGRVQKVASVLASMASAFFNETVRCYDDLSSRTTLAAFDARVWSLPSKCEVSNYFVWREQDAVRNSLQSLAQSHFSHRDLKNKKQSDLHEMLRGIGVNWANLPVKLKRGSYFQRVFQSCAKKDPEAGVSEITKRVFSRPKTVELDHGMLDISFEERVNIIFGSECLPT